MNSTKKILIVGLFLSESNKDKIQRTPADQLAELLQKNGHATINTSAYTQRILRLLDTVFTVIFKTKQYSIAIVPFYGGYRSFVWETITVSLLRWLNKKIVLVVHGGAIPQRMETKAARYMKTLQKADLVVCPSAYLIKELGKYGLQCTLIENVVNLNEYSFHLKQNIRPRVLWMRAFEYPYNPLMAIRAFAIIKQQYQEAVMVMAGYDQGMLEQTKKLAQQLNVFGSISFPGYISNEQKNELASNHDVYICTNTIDNAPISLIEMMALGLPVVTTNAGGIPYLVKDGHDCLMVDDNNAEAMAEKIGYLINNPKKAMALIANARASSKRFGEDVLIKKWQSVMDSLSTKQ